MKPSRKIEIFAHNFLLLILFLSFPLFSQAQTAPPATYDQIHRLTEQGKFDEALSALTEISKSDPAAKNLSHEFGIIYYRKGDYLNPITSLQKAIPTNPNHPDPTQPPPLPL